jgi:SSU ribosomal protein S20P
LANIKSSIKRIRVNEVRRLRNKSVKSSMRTAMKKVELALANQDAEQTKEALRAAIRKIDKAASKGVIHKNAANRYKSRLYKKVNSMQG